MFPVTSESVHRGIPVLSASCRGPLTGTIHFGVGSRDETVSNLGITHLLEHLLFRRMEPITVLHNGHTDGESMSMWASGTPEEVAAFVNAAGAAVRGIGDLSTEEVARELRVHAAEMTDHFTDYREGLLTYRFGARDGGLSQMGSPTMGALTPDEIIAWARTWLTAHNAVLTFTGSVPTELDLELPEGRVSRSTTDAGDIERPTLIGSAKAGVAVSLVVDERWAVLVADAVCAELREGLRAQKALVYSVDWHSFQLDESRRQVDVVLDPLPENVVSTVVETTRILRRVGEAGVSDTAMRTAVNYSRTALLYGDQAASGHLDRVAVDRLRGRTTTSLTQHWDQLLAATPGDLTEPLREALGTLIIAMSDDDDVEDPELVGLGLDADRFLGWRPDTLTEPPVGTTFRARRSGDAPRGSKLTMSARSLRLHARDLRITVDLDDVVLVGHRGCGCLDLLDSRGRVAKVDPDDWKSGDDLRQGLLSRFGPDRVRALPSH